jgi:hypothetical protein
VATGVGVAQAVRAMAATITTETINHRLFLNILILLFEIR